MKKIMITTIATIVLAVSMYCAPAQTTKGLSMNVAILKVSAKALRHFEKTFAGATGEKWSITASGFVTRFIFNGDVTRAFYDKNGNWLFTIAYFGEQKLPADIRATVKSVYYDYTILTVEAIQIGEKSIYMVDMKGTKDLKTVRVSDDEMEVVHDWPAL